MFKTLVEAGNYLFFHDRKLYDIAATSISESWPSVGVYEDHIKALVLQILRDGRESGSLNERPRWMKLSMPSTWSCFRTSIR